MYIDLQKHHLSYVIPLIKARMEVLKKRVLKTYGSDWYDLNDEQIEMKVAEKVDEFSRLQQTLETLEQAFYHHQRS